MDENAIVEASLLKSELDATFEVPLMKRHHQSWAARTVRVQPVLAPHKDWLHAAKAGRAARVWHQQGCCPPSRLVPKWNSCRLAAVYHQTEHSSRTAESWAAVVAGNPLAAG